MNDDEYPFLVGFDDDTVVVLVDEEAFTMAPSSAEALATDLQEMAEKAREYESPE